MPKILLALSLLVMMTAGCFDKAYYQPTKVVYQTPEKFGLKYQEVQFQSSDSTVLSGWFIPSTTQAKGTVIHFHGNAQNMTAHFSFVEWIPKNGFNLFVFDYRGYGKSQGQPSREGIYHDGLAALNYLLGQPGIDASKVIVLGQSLGGSIALSILGSHDFSRIRGVIIDSSFSSYRKIAKDVVQQTSLSSVATPVTSVAIRDQYSPEYVVDKISPTPIFFIHGTADQIVPYQHGVDLFNRAKDPKQLLTVKNGKHLEAFTKYGHEVLPIVYQKMLEWVN